MQTNEEVVAEIQAGNADLMGQLWRQCYGFICQQAYKWARAWSSRPDFDENDLIQAGYFALCDAVKGYQPERGLFLPFFAFYLKTEFSNVAGCRTAAQRKEPLNNSTSLDAPAYNDDEGETTLAETIAVEESGFDEVEECLYKERVSEVVQEAVESLPEKQRYAVEAHYIKGKTYTEIGAALNVAPSYSGRLVKDGLKGLRKGEHAPTLSELLWGEWNFYKHTSFTAWKETGSSAQEWALMWQEDYKKRRGLNESRGAKIRYCVEVRGMDQEQAEQLFAV